MHSSGRPGDRCAVRTTWGKVCQAHKCCGSTNLSLLHVQEKLKQQEDQRRAEALQRQKQVCYAPALALLLGLRKCHPLKPHIKAYVFQVIVETIALAPSRVGAFVSDYVGVANAAFLLVLLLFVGRWFTSTVGAPLWAWLTGRASSWSASGRWVYDRSMGGRKARLMLCLVAICYSYAR